MDNLMRRVAQILFSTMLSFFLLALVGCGSSGNSDPKDGIDHSKAKPETVLLSISRFGKGKISSTAESIFCDQALCQSLVGIDKEISLAAEPDDGWELYDWKGCDRVTGNVCTVTVSKDVLVEPSFKTIVPAQLRSDVFVMERETVDKILIKEDDYIILSPSATEISSLPIGTVLLSQFGQGFAGRITAIESNPGSSIIVSYRMARIFEVYGEGTLFGRLENESVKPTRRAARDLGATGKLDTWEIFDRTFEYPSNNSSDPGVKLKVASKLDITPDYSINLSWGSIDEMKLAYTTTIKLDPEVILEIPQRANDPQKIEPFKQFLPRFERPLMVGLVPFVVGIEPKVEFSYKSGVRIAMVHNSHLVTRMGVHYLKSSGLSGIGSSQTILSGTVDAEYGGEVQALLGLDLDLKVLGLSGPSLLVGNYAKAVAAGGISVTPGGSGTPECFSFLGTRGTKITGRLEADLHIFGEYSSSELTLLDKYKPFYKKSFGNGCLASIPPEPTSLTVEGKNHNSIRLSWKAPDTHEEIKHYEVYRDGVLIPASVASGNSLMFNDTGLQEKTNYCYYVRARTTDDLLTTESTSKCAMTESGPDQEAPTKPGPVEFDLVTSTAMKMSWQASQDNLGSKISYLVFLDVDPSDTDHEGDQLLAITTRLEAVVDKLQAATDYCVYVVASDKDGNTSEFSDTRCQETNERGAYRLRMKCAVQDDYAIDTALDLNTELTNEVNAIGHTKDYNGSDVQFALSGYYSNIHKILDAEVSWTFKGDSCVRQDKLALNLWSQLDQDKAMEQVRVCGCRAEVNISKDQAPEGSDVMRSHSLKSYINGGSTLSGQ